MFVRSFGKRQRWLEKEIHFTKMLRERRYLMEMAELPSLKQLQRAGNKKHVSSAELKRARRQALRCKTATEAYEKAKDAWSFMRPRQIIQVFLDREADLLGLNQPPPKPVFLDQRRVKWIRLNEREVDSAIRYLAAVKTQDQIVALLKQAKQLDKEQKTDESKARLKVYDKAFSEWKRLHAEWRKRANRLKRWFG